MGPEGWCKHHVHHHVLLLALLDCPLHYSLQLLSCLLPFESVKEAQRRNHWDSEAKIRSHLPGGPPEWLRWGMSRGHQSCPFGHKQLECKAVIHLRPNACFGLLSRFCTFTWLIQLTKGWVGVVSVIKKNEASLCVPVWREIKRLTVSG